MMLLSRWPSFLSRDIIFSFCFVLVSRNKASSRCILCIACSLGNVELVWVYWSSLSLLIIMRLRWQARFFLLLWCRSDVLGFWSWKHYCFKVYCYFYVDLSELFVSFCLILKDLLFELCCLVLFGVLTASYHYDRYDHYDHYYPYDRYSTSY